MTRQIYTNLNHSLRALTPEGIEFVLTPAGLPVRTIAYAIDKLFQWIIIFVLIIVYNAFGVWIFFIFNFIIDWFYHVICEISFRGQSLGKRIMGIRVVRSDGSPVDASSSFLRNLLRFADTFFFLFPIAFITMATSSGFRRIGDWGGGTIVVYSSLAKNTPYASLKNLLEKYEPVSPARALSSDEKLAILDFARRYSLVGEARANEIAGLYVPYLKGENSDNDNITDAAYLLGIARKLSGEL